MRRLAPWLAPIFLAGCNAPPPLVCSGGTEPTLMAELIFGRNVGDQLRVSDEDWRRFVDDELTPRFPDGFTILDASGQWRSGARILREPSKILVIALSGEREGRDRLAAAAAAYKRRFEQQSVITVLRPACVSF
jgi:uncharacterized protein DUF3574